jgi:hypothetical protein
MWVTSDPRGTMVGGRGRNGGAGWVGVAGQPSSFFVFLLFFLSSFLWPIESSIFFFFFFYTSFLQFFCFS